MKASKDASIVSADIEIKIRSPSRSLLTRDRPENPMTLTSCQRPTWTKVSLPMAHSTTPKIPHHPTTSRSLPLSGQCTVTGPWLTLGWFNSAWSRTSRRATYTFPFQSSADPPLITFGTKRHSVASRSRFYRKRPQRALASINSPECSHCSPFRDAVLPESESS